MIHKKTKNKTHTHTIPMLIRNTVYLIKMKHAEKMKNDSRWRTVNHGVCNALKDQLTANIKLTIMSIYLAHRIPELSCNSRFAIVKLRILAGIKLKYVNV